jgi:hypothetical protein
MPPRWLPILPACLWPQVALGFGFLCNFFTMASHSKHAPLDRIAHQLLALSMGLTAAFTFAEAVSPRSFMLSIGRCWALLLEVRAGLQVLLAASWAPSCRVLGAADGAVTT